MQAIGKIRVNINQQKRRGKNGTCSVEIFFDRTVFTTNEKYLHSSSQNIWNNNTLLSLNNSKICKCILFHTILFNLLEAFLLGITIFNKYPKSCLAYMSFHQSRSFVVPATYLRAKVI